MKAVRALVQTASLSTTVAPSSKNKNRGAKQQANLLRTRTGQGDSPPGFPSTDLQVKRMEAVRDVASNTQAMK